jgi:signal recognition particle subunit SRP54
MFENLTQRLGDVFDRLTRRGALSGADVDTALREVRVALLEADVALPVVKDFIDQVKTQAVGEAVLKSVTPGQMVMRSCTTTSCKCWVRRAARSTWKRSRRCRS